MWGCQDYSRSVVLDPKGPPCSYVPDLRTGIVVATHYDVGFQTRELLRGSSSAPGLGDALLADLDPVLSKNPN